MHQMRNSRRRIAESKARQCLDPSCFFRGGVGEGRVAWTGANLFAASFFVWLKVEICSEFIVLFASCFDDIEVVNLPCLTPSFGIKVAT